MLKPSAAILTTGIVLAGLGQLLTTFGTQLAVSSALRGESGTNVLIVLGGLVGLVGLVCAIIGVYRLATNVDAAAWQSRPAEPVQSAVEIRSRIQEIREQQRSH